MHCLCKLRNQGEKMKYEIKLDVFEGPFDLLYHLIEKNEIDIYNIPIAKITTQYLEYLNHMQELDMELASEFILMAATLIEIKSKMMLPNKKMEQIEFDINGLDPRRDLVVKLLEYKKYKNISDHLQSRQDIFGKFHFKPQDQLEEYIDFSNMKKEPLSLDETILINAVKRVISKASRIDNKRKKFFQELKRDTYTIENKIEYIQKALVESNNINFSSLFDDELTRLEIVVTFLALLELLKLKEIKICQEGNFDDILITKNSEV